MIQVVTEGPRAVVVREVDDPVPPPGGLVLRMERVGICGSDAHVYEGVPAFSGYPVVQGHEIVGIVESLGEGRTGPPIGSRVVVEPARGCGECIACRRGRPNCCVRLRVAGISGPGGLSTFVVIDGLTVHEVGDLEPDVAVFVEPLSIALHSIRRAGVGPDDSVVVLGGGSIGRAAVVAALDLGARVIVAERRSPRHGFIAGIGDVRIASDPDELARAVDELTSGEGCTVVIDTTGSGTMIELALDLLAPSGTLAVVGISDERVSMPVAMLSRKEITIVGSRNSIEDFPAAIALARRHPDVLRDTITHRFPLADGAEALRLSLEGDGAGKILVEGAA